MNIRFSSRQKKFAYLSLFLFSLTLAFQNCSNSFQSIGANSGSLSSLSSGLADPNGGPVTLPPGASADQKNRAACAANFNAPNFSSASTTDLSLSSGLSAMSGDISTLGSLTVQGTKSVINPSVESSSNCAVYTTFTARCSVIVDATHPANFTQAVGLDGSSLLSMNGDDKGKASLAGMALNLDSCNRNSNLSSGQADLKLTLNRSTTDPYARCVEGSFYVKVSLRSTVDVANKDSDAKYVKVTMANSCWNESRLKMNTEYPRISGVGAGAAIDGNWAVALADNQVMGSVGGVGALHIFNFDGSKWNYHSTIQPSDALSGDSLTAVAIKGSTMIATSAFRSGTGAALVYKLQGNSWIQTQVLTPPNGQSGQMFGRSISYDGVTMAIGAPNYSRAGSDKAGIVYIYTMSGANFGVSPTTIQVPDAAFENKGFGMSVSVSGNLIAVGSPQALTKESLGKGDVRIFKNSGTWTQVALKIPGTDVSDNVALKYGASVALSGVQLIIGAPGHDGGNGNVNSGAGIYFADYSATAATKVWKANELNGLFGSSVALGSAGIFVGGPKLDAMQGYADFYDFASLNRKYRIISYNRAPNDQLGFSLAVSGNNVMIGARVKDDSQVDSGAAYIYSMK